MQNFGSYCGRAPVTTALTAALLAAWAYGESLLDVRILLAGGKVPAVKTKESFQLTLKTWGNYWKSSLL